ncbi:MAG: ATP-binding protein [Rhodobacter sp.]|nr:ATP-binding protein [Rhodobacter sp.]
MSHDAALTPRAPRSPIKITLRATPMAVRDALAEARGGWRDLGLDPATCATAEQVLAEILNNVVEHALPDRPDALVVLECDAAGSGMAFEVRDDGDPMPGLRLPKGAAADIGEDPALLPEGGFGWFMIRQLTRDLSYRRQDGLNRLRFVIDRRT